MTKPKLAGPVLRAGDVALAALDAIEQDNPEKKLTVTDHGAFIRVEAEGGLILRRATMEEYIGRPFSMQEIETSLITFSGQIDVQDDFTRWYFLSDAKAEEGAPS